MELHRWEDVRAELIARRSARTGETVEAIEARLKVVRDWLRSELGLPEEPA